jgi:hypothetical protein
VATITTEQVRRRANREVELRKLAAPTLLRESVRAQKSDREYDIFLSHAIADVAEHNLLGLKGLLADAGFSVYVDWLEDPQLDRANVTADTAEILRKRMNCCRSLFYAVTPGSQSSKWMQWECGFFDGCKGRAAILPITPNPDYAYSGLEFLGVYPYVDLANDKQQNPTWWVNRSPEVYVRLSKWLAGDEPHLH